MTDAPAIVWFRNDLRLSDNPALLAAAASGRPIVPVYVLDDENAGDWAMGAASRWWLHHSLKSLARDIEKLGGRLILRRGDARAIIAELVSETGAGAVYWNRAYERWAIDRDTEIKSGLTDSGIDVRSFKGALIVEPWEISTKQGKPYKVYTPFWRALKAGHAPGEPAGRPDGLKFVDSVSCDDLDDWSLTPSEPDWAGGLRETWTPGESRRPRSSGRVHSAPHGALRHRTRLAGGKRNFWPFTAPSFRRDLAASDLGRGAQGRRRNQRRRRQLPQ